MTQLRAVIYARYSSDLQREASIEDQIRVCRDLIEKMDWKHVATFGDSAKSGTLEDRPGLQALVAEVKSGRADIVVAEGLDRISRDQEHIARLFKRITFWRAQIWTSSEGLISELHVGLKGTMNALYLKDLADKIRRGQKGRVLNERSAGGLAYGYKVVREFNPNGLVESGRRSVNAEEAGVIVKIFELYADGMSARQIAKLLNAERVPSPRGGQWNASSISGNRKRRDGILWNETYVGRLLYNRQTFLKNPETGKRVPRINPPKDWVVVDMPELRIVSDVLWQKAHARLDTKGRLPLHQRRGPRRLLSGLLYCGVCGGPFTIVGEGRIGCSAHKERGTCKNGKKLAARRVEDAVLSGIRGQLLHPDLIQEFRKSFSEEIGKARAVAAEIAINRVAILEEVEMRISRLLDAMQEGGALPPLVQRIKELEDQKTSLQHEAGQDTRSPPVAIPDPDLADLYRQKIDNLRSNLTANAKTQAKATELLRELIDGVEIHPIDGKGAALLKISGNMAAVAALGSKDPKTAVLVVAGEGVEPPTPGL